MYDKLFTPINIRGMALRNRVVFPAMATHFPTSDGFVTDALIGYHAARAAGGCGLNLLEAANVHAPSAGPGFLSICGDEYIPGLKKLADSIHAVGGKCGIQLWQGGLAAATMRPKEYIIPSDYNMIIPGGMGKLEFKAATIEQIQNAVRAFGEAAARAVKAGLDCVEFHAAHNYSPHMFLSPAFNQRTDEYGGSFENRARYLLESIRAIRQSVPEAYPVLMRVDALDDYLENGLTRDDVAQFCLLAKAEGVDVIDVSRGNIVTLAIKYEVPPIDLPLGFNVENAAYLKEKTGMLTIAVGRINDPGQAEAILEKGQADMVVMGRAQICDPEFCNKAQAGRTEDIVKCVACNQGCFDRYYDGRTYPHISCMRNPAVGYENDFEIKVTDQPLTIVVIGGGMGGMEAAITLKNRGHNPILIEENDELGGQFILAGLAPRKQEMREAALLRAEQIKRAGVDVRPGIVADVSLLDQIKPDAVINAVGGTPITISVPGSDGDNVYSSFDVLRGSVKLDGKSVIVIGGGLVGLEVAEFLTEGSCQVTVVEMLDTIGKDIGQGRRGSMLESVHIAGIKLQPATTCIAITNTGVIAKTGEGDAEIPAEAVVVAVGSKPRDSKWIEEYCKQHCISYNIIGDAVKTRRVIDAIHEGVHVARHI